MRGGQAGLIMGRGSAGGFLCLGFQGSHTPSIPNRGGRLVSGHERRQGRVHSGGAVNNYLIRSALGAFAEADDRLVIPTSRDRIVTSF